MHAAGDTTKPTLSITDNRTGKSYEIPIENETIKATDLRQIKVKDDDFGMMTYDPAFMNTASCKSTITFIDGDKGILRYRGYPIEQLAEKCIVPRSRVPPGLRRTPQQGAARRVDRSRSPRTRSSMRTSRSSWTASITTPTRWGCSSARSPRSPRSTRRAKKISDPARAEADDSTGSSARSPTLAAFAYRHSIGMPYVHPDNELSYAGNFLSMMFKIAEPKVQAEPGPGEGPRCAVHPPCRSRAELQHQRHARRRQLAGRSLQRRSCGGGSPVRPAARRRERGGAPDARRDRKHRQDPRVHQGGEGGQGPPDGLRSPGLQELRPARDHHQAARRPGLRGHRTQPETRHRPRARADRAAGRLLRQAEALSERRLLLRPDLPGDEVPGGHVPRAVCHRTHVRLARTVAGDACWTRTRRSPARGRSISATASATCSC